MGNTLPVRAATVESAVLAGGFLPASLANRGARGRFSVAIPAGFARDSMLPLVLAADFAAHSAIEMPLAPVPVLPVTGDFRPAIHRVRSACQMIATPFAVAVPTEHGLPGGLFRRRIERREALARRPFELVRELVDIVGDEAGGIARPRDRDIERALVDQIRVAGGHRRDDPAHRAALERMHPRRERAVVLLELRVVLPERGQRTVLQTEANPVPAHGIDRRGLAVGEPGGGIVAREAHPVAPAKLHRLAPVDLDPALGGGDARRPPRRPVALHVLKAQHAPAPVDAGDPARSSPLSTPSVL